MRQNIALIFKKKNKEKHTIHVLGLYPKQVWHSPKRGFWFYCVLKHFVQYTRTRTYHWFLSKYPKFFNNFRYPAFLSKGNLQSVGEIVWYGATDNGWFARLLDGAEKTKDYFRFRLLRRWPPMVANIIVAYLSSKVEKFNSSGVTCIWKSFRNVTRVF